MSIAARAVADIVRELERIRHMTDSPAAIAIEVAYVDRRDNFFNSREDHVESATRLCRHLSKSSRLGDSKLFAVSFVNDLSENPVCGVNACSPDELDRTTRLQDRALRAINELDAKLCGQDMFSMRRTRSRSFRSLKTAIRNSRDIAGGHIVILDNGLASSDLTSEVVFRSDSVDIVLATLDTSSRRIAAKCALLMAQHYVDVRNFVLSHDRSVKNICIIDFNMYTERDRVRHGARASFVLRPPSSTTHVWILNCNYFPDEDQPIRIQTTSFDDFDVR